MGERAGEMKDKLTGRVGETTQAMRDRASGAMDSARGTLNSAGQRMNDLSNSARERMSDLSDSARQQMERARGSMDYMMREQPLALGAIGLAVGALMAAMAPRTQKEDELMGEARDRLVDRAKEVGQEKLEDAKQVANAAMSTATKEAEKRGMTPSSASSSGSTGNQAKPSQPQTYPPLTPADTASKAQSTPKPSINPKPVSGTGTSTGTGTGTGTGKTGGTRNIP